MSAILIFILAFAGIELALTGFDPDTHRARLEKENQILRTRYLNLRLQTQRLDQQITELEKTSERLQGMIQAD